MDTDRATSCGRELRTESIRCSPCLRPRCASSTRTAAAFLRPTGSAETARAAPLRLRFDREFYRIGPGDALPHVELVGVVFDAAEC